MKKNLWLLMALFFVSCAHDYKGSVTQLEYPARLTEAKNYYAKKDYERAERQIKDYISNPDEIYWHAHAYILLGDVRAASGSLDTALEAYKQAVTLGAAYDQKVMTAALYKISWIYEQQKRYSELLPLLVDLQKQLTANDFFILRVETPARLANVYSILNMPVEAQASRAQIKPEDWARAYSLKEAHRVSNSSLYMAKIYASYAGMKSADKGESQNNLESFENLQIVERDLLDVGEMADLEIARKAYDTIRDGYAREWDRLKVMAKVKKTTEQEQIHRQKVDQIAQFIDQIEELKAARRPIHLSTHAPLSNDFTASMERIQKEAKTLVQKIDVGRAQNLKQNSKKKSGGQ